MRRTPHAVRMYFGKPGTTSVTSYYDIVDGQGVAADGESRIVWIDLATGRPVPLPAGIVDLLRDVTSEMS